MKKSFIPELVPFRSSLAISEVDWAGCAGKICPASKYIRVTLGTVHKIRLIYKRVSMEKIDKNENFRNLKTPIETLTPVL